MTLWERIPAEGCGCDAPEHRTALIGIDEALRRIAATARPVAETESVGLAQAVGRVLSGPVLARSVIPPFDNAAMDGYAIDTRGLAGSGPWRLPVAGRTAAGEAADRPLAPLAAARIFTGAPIPAGADAVVMQEDVRRDGDTIRIDRRPAPGLNIRSAGSDMRAGQVVLEGGCRLGPREIAACAAAGAGSVHVHRRLRIGLLVTGDEVRQAGDRRSDAEIWDINTPMLTAALALPCVHLVAVEHGSDRRGALGRQLAGLAERADLVITTGGISVGEEDHVKPALAALGAETLFSGVAIKPGKPVSFGRVGPALWLGLPGNPLSAFVTWQIFGAALLRRLTGQTSPGTRRRHVLTAEPIRRKPGRCELRPVTLSGFDGTGREIVRFEEATHSGRVGRLPQSDGLIFLHAEADTLPEGALVEFHPFCDS